MRIIVTGYAPVGPNSERLSAAKRALDDAGLTLIQIRRRYDTLAWPHASKGYFGLKAKIPFILSELDIHSPTNSTQNQRHFFPLTQRPLGITALAPDERKPCSLRTRPGTRTLAAESTDKEGERGNPQ